MDLVFRVHRRPGPGETAIGEGFGMFLGGKGFNQAVAARRLGADATFVGRCGADDFKFLPTSTEPWAEIFPDPQRLARWFEICCRAVPDRFRMFHYRLGTLSSGGHGFRELRRRQCFQCLDDRAYDSRGVYSCVVRLREGCAPLYAHADPTEVKRRKLRAFLSGDRSRDRICRRLCFDLYRDLNQRVEQLLGIEPAGKA